MTTARQNMVCVGGWNVGGRIKLNAAMQVWYNLEMVRTYINEKQLSNKLAI